MHKMHKMFIGILSAMVIASLLSFGCAPSTPTSVPSQPTATQTTPAKVYTIKTAHGTSTTSTRHLTYVNFKELVEKYSNGRITMTIHPSGSLYGDAETFEACMTGSIQMVQQASSQVTKVLPMGDLFMCPGVFKDADGFYKSAKSAEMVQLLKPLEAKGLHPLGQNLNSLATGYLSNAKAIRTPADLAGLKMRTSAGDFARLIAEAVGAKPVVIEVSEVAAALQQKAVDAYWGGFVTAISGKMNELTKYYTTGIVMGPSPNTVVMNKAFWDSLPKDLQDVVAKAWLENLDYNAQIVKEVEQKSRDTAAKTGDLYILDGAPNVDVWAKAMQPVLDFFIAKNDPANWALYKKSAGLP